MNPNRARWRAVHAQLRGRLLAAREGQAFWLGRLADSALATATAVAALAAARRADDADAIARGLAWLARTQNADGGWGDTPQSPSNLPTSLLVLAAHKLARKMPPPAGVAYVDVRGGEGAISGLYGADRTFSVPILTCCAIAGLVDWSAVEPLPMELAALPRRLFPLLGLPVVSYALPALIAMGLVRHARLPSANPLVRLVRSAVTPTVLHRLETLQPAGGGFLEAVPLTAFVAMSLVAAGQREHPVVRDGLEFLRRNVRAEGCWPIDSNLSIWNTTLAIAALAGGDEPARDWLLDRQLQRRHLYTGAAPGGWGWSHLAGSVPDVDDTAGALVALSYLPPGPRTAEAAQRGLVWLLDVQNRDGGWPTFCRGWGKLEFDRSGCDLTAHAIAALASCQVAQAFSLWPAEGKRLSRRIQRACAAGGDFLCRHQRADGSWLPLWFGSQKTADQTNPVFGTARVLRHLRVAEEQGEAMARQPAIRAAVARAIAYLHNAAHAEGGWGAAAGVEPTVEETAAVVEALAGRPGLEQEGSIARAVDWLCDRVEAGQLDCPSPIGLYFARLWYHERLYPLTLAVAALRQATAAAPTVREDE